MFLLGMNVVFCTISHEIGGFEKRASKNTYENIIIGQGTWIGANTIVLPGVKIGEGCVIAAGSVVIRGCEPNILYAGNLAVIKGNISEYM